ncbi:MAG TPA: DUF952 domain-containing protein [Pirellulales bacterium]|nr:DUF952 domain-containing protein [Pirellulales bacterium]
MTDHIYILIAADDLRIAERSGVYRATSLAAEGFIHASPRNQLARVANKYYRSAGDLRLLHIDPERVAAEIRWEPAAGSLYPHIYGPLNMDAVVGTTAVLRAESGQWDPELGIE